MYRQFHSPDDFHVEATETRGNQGMVSTIFLYLLEQGG